MANESVANDGEKQQQWESRFKSLEAEYQEYQEYSRSLEEEQQLQLNQREAELQQVMRRVSRVEQERDTALERLSRLAQMSQSRIESLEQKLQAAEAANREHCLRIRQLELVNDNLERSNRSALAQLKDKEQSFDELLEKNALLESQIEEQTNQAHVEIQRLKDELRDARTTAENSSVVGCPADILHNSSSAALVECGFPPQNGNPPAFCPVKSTSNNNSGKGGTVRFLNYLIEKIDGIDKDLGRCCRRSRMPT